VAESIALEHVGIPTSNELYQREVQFYIDAFGWTILRQIHPPLPEMQITFLTDGRGGRIEVFTAEGPPLSHPSHLAFATSASEFDALKRRLEAAGIVFDSISKNPAGDTLAYFNDPAGNRAQVVGRITPLPQ
jgi:predicted enzyme related to lactoylglutathione lyase